MYQFVGEFRLSRKEQRKAVKRLQEATERASAWFVTRLKRAISKTV